MKAATHVDEVNENVVKVTESGPGLHKEAQLLLKILPKWDLQGINLINEYLTRDAATFSMKPQMSWLDCFRSSARLRALYVNTA